MAGGSETHSRHEMRNLERVVVEMQNGSRRAYEDLLDHFQPRVYRLARRVTGDGEDSRDVAQEVFLAVYRRRRELRDPSRFGSWTYRMTYCQAVDRVRARRPAEKGPGLDETGSPEPKDETVGPAEQAEQAEFRRELQRELDSLPGKFREPLVLSTHGGLSYEQIAQEFDCPVGTIRSRIHTARQILRDRLATWFGGETS